jgi:DNA integrity scanning protein DisA with diadenylate cyclase activity
MKHVEVIINSAIDIAKKLEASAIVVVTETGDCFEEFKKAKLRLPVIFATASEELFQNMLKEATESTLEVEFVDKEVKRSLPEVHVLKLLTRKSSVAEMIEDAIVRGLEKGIIHDKDVIIAVGSTLNTEANSIFYYEVKAEALDLALYHFLRDIEVKPEVFEAVLNIALEIGKEGREGRMIGTAFLIGDSKKILANSRQLILNPFEGHLVGERSVLNPEIKETIKELAQLDGVFVISSDGIIESAGVHLNVDTSSVDIPRGLGSRHAAVAATTAKTRSIGITVSQSGGIVRVFKDGKVVLTIEPQRRFSMK